MSDFEPQFHPPIDIESLLSKKNIDQTSPSPSLKILRQEVTQKDLLWVKNSYQNIINEIHSIIPPENPPTTANISFSSEDHSLYGSVYNYNLPIYATRTEWNLSGGNSLQKAGFLKTTKYSDNQVLEYTKNPDQQNWDLAKKIVKNDSYFKRYQQLGNALEIIDPKKANKYSIDFKLNPEQSEDQIIIQKYKQNGLLKTEQNDSEFQLTLDLSHPPGNEFLFTTTAIQFFETLDKVALKLNSTLKNEMVNRSKQRYGNSYVTLGRELAKLVSNNDRHLSSFFSTDINNKEEILNKIKSLKVPNDPAAATLINIIKQLPDQKTNSDLPVSQSKISFHTGTCKDLETYFSSSVNENSHYFVEINGKKYLKEGSHHPDVNPMMINLETITFNGVSLPVGNLFRIDQDQNTYHYMRPTAFCFKQTYIANIFGKEYRDSINSWGPPDKIFEIIFSE